MQIILQALSTLAALLGPAATIVDLVHVRGWQTIAGAMVLVVVAGITLSAFYTRRRTASSSVEIEGISIDSLNAANIRRRVNRSLIVQAAEHIATIDGQDLNIVWRYAGYCRATNESAMEFSIEATHSIPFSQLDCRAYDLRHDPDKQSPIHPLLIGPDGISKKVAVPFLARITANQPFDVMLRCRLPVTYTPGVCYYTSTLSFAQRRVGHCAVTLKFLRGPPLWVRVYEIGNSGRPRLLKSLHCIRNGTDGCEYRDVAENISAKSVRIYLFELDSV